MLLPDNAAVIKVAEYCGKDLQWLIARNLLRSPWSPTADQAAGAEAFALRQKGLAAALEAEQEIPAELLFSSLHAFDYLRRTRLLIWLATDVDQYSLPGIPKLQLQDLLQREIATIDDGTNSCLQLIASRKPDVSCDGAPYQQWVQKLHDAINKIVRFEKKVMREMASRES